MHFLDKAGLEHLVIRILEKLNIKANADEALFKTPQELTDDEKDQVRKNLRFIGKNVEGQEFVIDGTTKVASPSAEIFGDYDTNIAIGQWSIAEGSGTKAIGRASHAEGAYGQAIADGTHVEGYQTEATGYWSHAEGEMTKVTSYASHAEGSYCTLPDGTKRYGTASGYASHVEGGGCHATASCSHVEGLATTASGAQAHAEGRYTIAAGGAQHVEGIANIEDAEGKYLHIAGNGTFDDRSNAHTLDWNGNGWFAGDVYVGSTSGKDKDEGSKKLATEDQIEDLYNRLNSNATLGFYCVEDVTIVLNGVSTIYPANSNVEIKLLDTDVFEIIPTSDHSILSLNAFPGALGTYYPWLEGVKQFSNILFDMNNVDFYSKWSQGNQGSYQVQYAQYINCIFWSDNPYVSDVAKRTNYTLYYTSQLPLCYSSIPDNTFKSFYLAFNANSDPNWGNKVYRDSFAKATWATQVFSYYGARTIGIFGHDDPDFNIVLPKDCRGLMYQSTAIENAGTFDAINVTNFGATGSSWQQAFGQCSSLKNLYIKNLKVNLNISWSPINYQSISFIISKAVNENAITISVSPYTYNLLSPADFALAESKNITIKLITTNYVEDKRLSDIANKVDKTDVLLNEEIDIICGNYEEV